MAGEDYLWIRKWGVMLQSYDYFIDEQVKKARDSGAPTNAIYQRRDGSWATINDIESSWCRAQLGLSLT